MTKRKYADRLTLEEALEKAAYISEQRRENKCLLSAERIGMGILNLYFLYCWRLSMLIYLHGAYRVGEILVKTDR